MLDFNSSEIIVVRFRIHHLHGAEPTKDVISMLVYIFPFAPSVSFDSAPIFKSSILPIGDEFLSSELLGVLSVLFLFFRKHFIQLSESSVMELTKLFKIFYL